MSGFGGDWVSMMEIRLVWCRVSNYGGQLVNMLESGWVLWRVGGYGYGEEWLSIV